MVRGVVVDAWPTSLRAHVTRGMALAVKEDYEQHGTRRALATAATLSRLAFDELVRFPLTMLPLAARSVRYRRANVRVLGKPTLELYSREEDDDASSAKPLVLYVHGGSWGQGAPWNYALMAERLLASGASAVAIAQYTLFPRGDVDTMVAEIEDVLRWCASVKKPGQRVVLAAHSAGAHLCALLLARASYARTASSLRSSGPGEPPRGDILPDRFVALSGVYDIAAHFAHENSRLVHWLSPMWLAMIGRRALDANETRFEEDAGSFAQLLSLNVVLGDDACTSSVCSDRLQEVGLTPQAILTSAQLPSSSTDRARQFRNVDLVRFASSSPRRVLSLQREVAAASGEARALQQPRWPATVILHASDDTTVPVRSSRLFAEALRECGEDVTLVEHGGGHGEIIVQLMSRRELSELPQICQDFVAEVVAA